MLSEQGMVEHSGHGIAVAGTGSVGVRPDVLVARLGAEVTLETMQAALDRCSAAFAALTTALRDAGVADIDLATSGASVRTAYDPHGNAHGWNATQQLTARLRDLSVAGDYISRAIGAAGDAARLHDITFSVDDDADARTEARRRAFADAENKAQLYAELAGRALGPVEAVTENNGGAGGVVSLRKASHHEPLSALPLEAGTLEVTVQVAVRWSFA